jgi:O-antigen/teichoic acid export membrane protein
LTDAAADRQDAAAASSGSAYGRGARILSIGIAATGLFSFAYFAVASHVLGPTSYGQITLLWAILFVVISVIYRPVEQLLSRSIADRRARGHDGGHPLRVPLALQAGFALAFLAAALLLRTRLDDLFGSASLTWIFIGAGVAYAASYFARGYFAGHRWFGLYGGLVLFESISRFCFPVAVAVGLASGQTAVALGILAAPLASLLVVPWAIARHRRLDAAAPQPDAALTLREGGGFALAVAGIQLGEQALLNAGVIVADAVSSAAVAGAVFNVLLITRAPLQLFQAVQTSLLPHLAGLEATDDPGEFDRAIRVTIRAIAAFAALVALVLLLIGPWIMQLVFGDDIEYGRVGLAVVAIGMGLHLAAGTLNQAALARGRARAACAAWLACATGFVVWMTLPAVGDVLLRAEVGYAGAAAILCVLLAGLHRRARGDRATSAGHAAMTGTS